MKIREYKSFRESEIRKLYDSAGWTAYTGDMDKLRAGFRNSLLVLAAYDEDDLVGLIRVIGDGCTMVFIQDLLVEPAHQREGIGTALIDEVLERYADVRQIMLLSDDIPENAAFYESVGFEDCLEIGCRGYLKTGGKHETAA